MGEMTPHNNVQFKIANMGKESEAKARGRASVAAAGRVAAAGGGAVAPAGPPAAAAATDQRRGGGEGSEIGGRQNRWGVRIRQ